MSNDCAACRSSNDLFLPVPAVPPAWRPIAEAGVSVAPWVPADAVGTRVLYCTACGTRWCLFHDDRDGNNLRAATSFPPEADPVLQADAPATTVVTAGLAHPGSAEMAALWIEHAPAPAPAAVVTAIGNALRSVPNAYDAGQCLRWLSSAITKHRAAARALAEAPALLALLQALPDQTWSNTGPPGMTPDAMAALAARIGETIERLAPAAAASLRHPATPTAQRDRALAALQRYLAGEAPDDTVRLAGVALSHFQVAALPLAESQVSLMLDVLDRVRSADARLAHPHARALRLQLAAWLKAGALPPTIQDRVARTLGTSRK